VYSEIAVIPPELLGIVLPGVMRAVELTAGGTQSPNHRIRQHLALQPPEAEGRADEVEH
jgi:hypothetical protein